MDTPEDKSIDYAPKHIPIEDILSYAKKGLSNSDIAKIVGCTKQNVQQRLADLNIQSLPNYSTFKDGVFEHLQRRFIDNIDHATIQKLNPLQRVTAAAILEDKIRTIRGQATEIVEQRQIKVDLDKAYAAMTRAGVDSTGQAQDVVEAQAPEGGGGGVE